MNSANCTCIWIQATEKEHLCSLQDFWLYCEERSDIRSLRDRRSVTLESTMSLPVFLTVGSLWCGLLWFARCSCCVCSRASLLLCSMWSRMACTVSDNVCLLWKCVSCFHRDKSTIKMTDVGLTESEQQVIGKNKVPGPFNM